MKNDRMNTSESVESAGEEMAEEAKHSNETEGNTEAGAADRQKEQLDIPRDLSYKQIFLSKGNNTLGYKYLFIPAVSFVKISILLCTLTELLWKGLPG